MQKIEDEIYQNKNSIKNPKKVSTIKKKFIFYKLSFYFFCLLFILMVIFVYQVYKSNPNLRIPLPFQKASNEEKIKIENEKMMKYIATLIQLPDEEPVIADILTKETIESQPFFENAEIGDKLIIFYNSKKAMLYSPETKLIKELANIKEADPDLPREMLGI